jgi:hypothetical protein
MTAALAVYLASINTVAEIVQCGEPLSSSLTPSEGQKGARPHGNAGIPGIPGNVVCVNLQNLTEYPRDRIPLSANSKNMKLNDLYS